MGYSGDYNLTIEVMDGGTNPNKGYGYLYITVLPANNGAPQWVIPSESNVTVNVLEVGAGETKNCTSVLIV